MEALNELKTAVNNDTKVDQEGALLCFKLVFYIKRN